MPSLVSPWSGSRGSADIRRYLKAEIGGFVLGIFVPPGEGTTVLSTERRLVQCSWGAGEVTMVTSRPPWEKERRGSLAPGCASAIQLRRHASVAGAAACCAATMRRPMPSEAQGKQRQRLPIRAHGPSPLRPCAGRARSGRKPGAQVPRWRQSGGQAARRPGLCSKESFEIQKGGLPVPEAAQARACLSRKKC